MNRKKEGNPCADVVLVSIDWGENGRAALIPLSSSTSRSALVYPHFAWHACRITCWNLVNIQREPRYYVQNPQEEFSEHSLRKRELETLRFDTSYDFFVRVWKSLFGIRLSKTLRLVKIFTILWSFFVFICLIHTNTNEWR